MKAEKEINNCSVVSLANLMQRNEEGVLGVSRETIKKMKTLKKDYDFNINCLRMENKVIRFKVNSAKKAFFAEEFILDSERDTYIYVGERPLAELLKSGEISNALYIPVLEVIIVNVRLESCVLLAGSFNPLHHGHTQLLNDACKTTGQDCLGVYELSISNCSKSEIDDLEIVRRAHQFVDDQMPLLITNRPYFRDKVTFIDSNSWFCIGADTYKRFFDVKYYESPEQLIEFTEFLVKNGVQLLVGPRLNTDKVDKVQDYLSQVPDGYRLSVKEIENFRVDISSTEIRKVGSTVL